MAPKREFNTLVGVIGGVGPEATVDFFSKVVKRKRNLDLGIQDALQGGANISDIEVVVRGLSYADYSTKDVEFLTALRLGKKGSVDQDHVPLLIYNNPQIPDRTGFILDPKEGMPNPYDYMLHSARALVAGGAKAICVPCNTAHYFLPDVEATVNDPNVQFLNMLELTMEFAKRRFGGVSGEKLKIGLLATSGTCTSGVYHNAARQVSSDIEVIMLSDFSDGCQDKVMEAIYGPKGIKAGYDNLNSEEGLINHHLLKDEGRKLMNHGARAVIMGCTEIPLVLDETVEKEVIFINPTAILVDQAIRCTVLSAEIPNVIHSKL